MASDLLSRLVLPLLHQRFPNRGLASGQPPEPIAVFPGTHPGIRRVAIYDDGDELTVSIDDLTHGHFTEYAEALPDAERAKRIIESVVNFLDALFADKIVVWGHHDAGGGWYRPDLGSGESLGIPEFVWSGPRK
jgi:hypothetical protein